MKFRAKQTVMGITAGKIYHGSVTVVTEDRGEHVQPRTTDVVHIVVFNDNGRWHAYSMTIAFEPVD